MLLNLRALAYPHHARDMEMTTSTVHFSLLKSCKTTPDVALATVKNVYSVSRVSTHLGAYRRRDVLKLMVHNHQFAVVIRICGC